MAGLLKNEERLSRLQTYEPVSEVSLRTISHFKDKVHHFCNSVNHHFRNLQFIDDLCNYNFLLQPKISKVNTTKKYSSNFQSLEESENTSYIKGDISSTESIDFRDSTMPEIAANKIRDYFSNTMLADAESPTKVSSIASNKQIVNSGWEDQSYDSKDFLTSLYYQTKYGSSFHVRPKRHCPHIQGCVTKSSSIEQVRFHNSAEKPRGFAVPVKRISNPTELKKMKKNKRLMQVIQSRIDKEMLTCGRIPEITRNKAGESTTDMKFVVLRHAFDKTLPPPRAHSLFGLSRKVSVLDPAAG